MSDKLSPKDEQRADFAFGNVKMHNPDVTLEMCREAVRRKSAEEKAPSLLDLIGIDKDYPISAAHFRQHLRDCEWMPPEHAELLQKLRALIERLSDGSERSREIAEELKAIVGDER